MTDKEVKLKKLHFVIMLYLNSNILHVTTYFNRRNRQNEFNTNVNLFREETFKWCLSFIVEFGVTLNDPIGHSDNYHLDLH